MNRLVWVLCLLVVLSGARAPSVAQARARIPQHLRALSLAQQESLRAIYWAASYWGVSATWLERVAWCESGLWPGAYNPYSGAAGLFQFLPATYYWMAQSIGETRSYWNPWAAANVAGWAFSRGYATQWACVNA